MTSHLYDYYNYSELINSNIKDLENLRNFFQGLNHRLEVLQNISTCLLCLTYSDRKFTSIELDALGRKIYRWKEYKNKILEADIKALFNLGFGG